jgi:myo-inositol-1-phosphate synthase
MAKSEQKKDAALVALLDSSSLTEAAEKAGVSRRTMYSYLHNDIDFARAYDEARNRQEVAYMDALTARRERAQGVVMEVLEDDDQPAAIRLKAAQIIIAAAAEQEKTIARITQANIAANKDMCDVSCR